jgi:APA family basic amino acid/polyamine antiporter
VKEASKNVPLATLASIGIVVVIYTGVVVALLSAKLPSYGSQSVFDASVILLGASGGAIVAFAAVISTLSAANANIIGASRVVLEMASEGQVPGRFASLKNDQPVNSILLGSATTMLLIVYGSLNFIIDLTNVLVLVTMFFVNVSAFMLIRKERNLPPEKSRFKIPLGGLFPALGAASCLLMLSTISSPTLVMGLVAILLGSILHLLEDTPQGRSTLEDIRELLGRSESFLGGDDDGRIIPRVERLHCQKI